MYVFILAHGLNKENLNLNQNLAPPSRAGINGGITQIRRIGRAAYFRISGNVTLSQKYKQLQITVNTVNIIRNNVISDNGNPPKS